MHPFKRPIQFTIILLAMTLAGFSALFGILPSDWGGRFLVFMFPQHSETAFEVEQRPEVLVWGFKHESQGEGPCCFTAKWQHFAGETLVYDHADRILVNTPDRHKKACRWEDGVLFCNFDADGEVFTVFGCDSPPYEEGRKSSGPMEDLENFGCTELASID